MECLNHNLKDLPDQDLLRGFQALTSNPFFRELELRAQATQKTLRQTTESEEPVPGDVNYIYRMHKNIGMTNGVAHPFREVHGIIETLTNKLTGGE